MTNKTWPKGIESKHRFVDDGKCVLDLCKKCASSIAGRRVEDFPSYFEALCCDNCGTPFGGDGDGEE